MVRLHSDHSWTAFRSRNTLLSVISFETISFPFDSTPCFEYFSDLGQSEPFVGVLRRQVGGDQGQLVRLLVVARLFVKHAQRPEGFRISGSLKKTTEGRHWFIPPTLIKE